MSRAEEWISASFKERIFFAMQSSEVLREFGILLEITVDRFVFCCVVTLILCFEDSFAVDWSIIVDNAIFQFRCSYQTTWIYFILMWMKRRIQKVKKFELLISTSTYELQLYNGYIFIFYFKIWQWYIAFLSKILYISDVINEFVVISDIRYGVFREP